MAVKEQEKYAAKTRHGKNFSSFDAGRLDDLFQYELSHPKIDRPVRGKLFIKEIIGLTGMQISLNRLPAGVSVPFVHQHMENEEVYVFVKGKGQMQIDGEVIDVQEGSVVRISPDGARVWRNNSDQDLYYVVIQAKEGSLRQDTFEDGLPSQSPPSW